MESGKERPLLIDTVLVLGIGFKKGKAAFKIAVNPPVGLPVAVEVRAVIPALAECIYAIHLGEQTKAKRLTSAQFLVDIRAERQGVVDIVYGDQTRLWAAFL